ncbi:MAG: fasciclin domain-containing protein [Gracilimonas sp.]|nr:fasciclin domain-containing protein [Gracilimonas sp.]
MKTLSKITGVFAIVATLLLSTNLKAQDSDIVDLAVATDDLSTLVTAVKAAGLVETLQGDGPFTVFAPTNAAFEALPEGVLEMLLKPENKDKLTAVLTYHVIPAEVMSGDLKDGMKAGTVEGSNATISIKYGKVMVDNANVVMADAA